MNRNAPTSPRTMTVHHHDRNARLAALFATAAVMSVIGAAGPDSPVSYDQDPPRPPSYVAGGIWGGA